MEKPKIIKIGSGEIEYYSEPEYVSRRLVATMEKWLNKKWLDAVLQFPCENPDHLWAGIKKFKKPTPILRVEMSPRGSDSEFKNRIYSIGKRPTLGVLTITNYCPEHRQEILRAAECKIAGFIQIGNKLVKDDEYFAREILGVPYYTEIPYGKAPEGYPSMSREQLKKYQQACLEGQYFWVRTDPHGEYSKELLEKLESISLVPVRADGCKSEFMTLGMAVLLSEVLSNGGSLSWKKSFVMKPVQGTWGDNVEIYHSDDTDEERIRFFGKMQNLVQTIGPEKIMIQPYIPPRVVERGGRKYNEIWKLCFALLPDEKSGGGKYTFTGGVVQGSLSEKVCGVEGTYSRPLLTR